MDSSHQSFRQVLDAIGNRLDLHAKLLNTLSLVEYIGARKIVKSQKDREITFEVLGHMAEEIRHAQVLKALSLKLSDGQTASYEEKDLLCGAAGKAYIQVIDREIERLLTSSEQSNSWLNYLLTTLVVEERASEVYPLYNEYLGQLGFPNKLISIIRDEHKHLETVVEQVKDAHMEGTLERFRTIEMREFGKMMDAFFSEIKSRA